ncbi:hypothetical protein, partial [Proteus mirabilis]|uniref:hypothetical protein n=1 Tax=Proteus mirabilis TaxID=584 RepID=UPI001953367C
LQPFESAAVADRELSRTDRVATPQRGHAFRLLRARHIEDANAIEAFMISAAGSFHRAWSRR